jgi:hypothetical protein
MWEKSSLIDSSNEQTEIPYHKSVTKKVSLLTITAVTISTHGESRD